MGRTHLTRSARVLLAELIDYAGLFPPASLSMPDAVARYARYRSGPHAWMLGRFIVPRARLDEFKQDALSQLANSSAREAQWRVSMLASDDLATDARALEAFNATTNARIDTVEAKVASADDVMRVSEALRGEQQPPLALWLEVSPGASLHATLDAIARAGAGAKLRTGGVTPDAIPPAAAVAEFLIACARGGIACKMTAGLHHPVHAPHRLTYADDSPTALMHGFVNVFLAAALAREEMGRGRDDRDIAAAVTGLLDERDPHRIVWHDDHVAWRGHRLEVDAIAAVRARFARSFGSCSFDEPVADLAHLGWL